MTQKNHQHDDTTAPRHDELEHVLVALEKAEERLAMMERQLAHAERLATLGTLVGGVAHEFNNLLTPVMSYAQLALSDPSDTELTKKALERAYRGAERAARVASSMLGFGRSGHEPEVCRVRDAMDAALETARLEATHERIALITDVPDDLYAGLACLSLQQVFVNLFLNARHAIRPEAGTISVSAQRSTWNTDDSEAPCCKITVADSGCGIEPEILSTLFTPYQTGPERNGTPGTGLGLSICERLVRGVGGQINVQSTIGKGTKFTILLPLGDATQAEQAHTGTSAA